MLVMMFHPSTRYCHRTGRVLGGWSAPELLVVEVSEAVEPPPVEPLGPDALARAPRPQGHQVTRVTKPRPAIIK